MWAPITTSGVTWAAGSSGLTASTRRLWPSAIAAWWVILASCPPPTMATIGGLGLFDTAIMVSDLHEYAHVR
ncbi:hypothetical protein MSAR_04380 [Mycolicibacterium sarraceniae]|uniref:Uncharacterized protein n=1 Tax=Mycolicibacterium sarraceniae TaxID=1534348 RepID=A0A7I7SK60_9MYCO|nr:hypothetical protein MSAR_04380 [Mycolicibacterium sarraceniae]